MSNSSSDNKDFFEKILDLDDRISSQCKRNLKYCLGNIFEEIFFHDIFFLTDRRIMITEWLSKKDKFSTFDFKGLYTDEEKNLINEHCHIETKATSNSEEKYEDQILINQIQYDKSLKELNRHNLFILAYYHFLDDSLTLYDYKKLEPIKENITVKYTKTKKVILKLTNAYMKEYRNILGPSNREIIRNEQIIELKKHLESCTINDCLLS